MVRTFAHTFLNLCNLRNLCIHERDSRPILGTLGNCLQTAMSCLGPGLDVERPFNSSISAQPCGVIFKREQKGFLWARLWRM
jgi:hypothetical protein